MSRLPLLIFALLACAVTPANAQNQRGQECWNPQAGHFEGVRPGEVQNDLDFNRCRPIGGSRRASSRDVPQECWHPGARHYEGVRPGEAQNDLDFARCRPVSNVRDAAQECWNPRAGHFEGVRPGEVQNDLDFTRCRRR